MSAAITDRELLELAAKAAGIYGEYSDRAEAIVNEDGYWMPQKDYGDALRLVETLGLLVGRGTLSKDEFFASRKDLAGMQFDTDICRAIVRAAAEIGRAMP